MKTFKALTGTVLLLLLFLTQSCNEPSIENASKLKPMNLRVGGKEETINRIKNLKEFKNILQIQNDHIKLLKLKEIKSKKLTAGEVENFKAKLGSVKSKEDIKKSFSIITGCDVIVDFTSVLHGNYHCFLPLLRQSGPGSAKRSQHKRPPTL